MNRFKCVIRIGVRQVLIKFIYSGIYCVTFGVHHVLIKFSYSDIQYNANQKGPINTSRLVIDQNEHDFLKFTQ